MHRRSALWVILTLPLFAGCGTKQVPVSGKVTYNGQPVPGGTVFFRPADPKQNTVTAELDSEGKFTATLPEGEISVCVDNRELEPQNSIPGIMPPGVTLPKELTGGKGKNVGGEGKENEGEERKKVSGRYVRIPEKFYAVETSGLSIKISGTGQVVDLQLKD